jgi:hypothetical protein
MRLAGPAVFPQGSEWSQCGCTHRQSSTPRVSVKTLATQPVLRDNGIVSTPDLGVDYWYVQMERVGWVGVVAELNCGRMIPPTRITMSLQQRYDTVRSRYQAWRVPGRTGAMQPQTRKRTIREEGARHADR